MRYVVNKMDSYHAKCRTGDCCLASGSWISVSVVRDWINAHFNMYGHTDIEFQVYNLEENKFTDEKLPLSL